MFVILVLLIQYHLSVSVYDLPVVDVVYVLYSQSSVYNYPLAAWQGFDLWRFDGILVTWNHISHATLGIQQGSSVVQHTDERCECGLRPPNPETDQYHADRKPCHARLAIKQRWQRCHELDKCAA